MKNLIEILKQCPSGMELNCSMYSNLYFDRIEETSIFPIVTYTINNDVKNLILFTETGCYNRHGTAKCVIFPKGKTTWEGFHRPVVEGDIVSTESGMYIGIVKSTKDSHQCCTYCSIHGKKDFHIGRELLFNRFATKEEKQIVFDIIKANGYRWNPDTNTLEKLIEPRFKVGDRIKHKSERCYPRTITIKAIENECYIFEEIWSTMSFNEQDHYELVPNKFDISTLKPFESKVLVRTENSNVWEGDIFVRYDRNATVNKFHCIGGWYEKCIPFKGNEWLLGTTDDCDKFYKTWQQC